MEEELKLLTEEERQERILQQYEYQLNLLEHVRTFMLMGYETPDIYEVLKSLRFTVSREQIDFFCEYINDRKKQTIQEINAELFKFLYEIDPPEMWKPEPESEPKKQFEKEAVSSYMCRIVVLNLLVDRIDYLKSVLKAGGFDMVHFINAGYDTCYVETMKQVIEENPKMHSRDIARRVYKILYRDAKHMEGFIYSIDKLDFWDMIHTCREKWQTARKQHEKEDIKND